MRKIFLILLMILWLMPSCQRAPACPPQTKTLRLSIPEEPMTLDPRKGGDALSSQLHFMLYEGLTVLNSDGTVRMGQCHKITTSKDRLTYTFSLGKTRWSDGTSVTAFDFEKAWKDILDPSFPAPNAHLLYCIKGAEEAKKGIIPLCDVGISASDPYTFIIKLKEPTPYFLQLISFCVFAPTCKEEQQIKAPRHNGPPCNGPFILAHWKHHNELLLVKNPLYRDPSAIHLDAIKIQVIPSETTAFQMYENDELDFLGHPFHTVPADAIASVRQKSLLMTVPSAATNLITFNCESSVFCNQHLRKAFALAIDRRAIVQHMTELDEIVATDAVPPILKENTTHPFYIDNQKELALHHLACGMQEEGIKQKELQSLTFYYSHSEGHHKVAQVLQQQWLDTLGILVRLQALEHKSLLDKLIKRDYSFALTMWRAQYFDPLSILERFKVKENKKNYPGWFNKEYVHLLDSAKDKTQQKRLETLMLAEKILMEEMPLAPLYHFNMSYLCSERLDHMEFSPVGGIFFERLSIR